MPQPAYAYGPAPQYAVAPLRRRTGWMVFAQVIVIIEASLGILVSLAIIALGILVVINVASVNDALNSIPGYNQLPSNFYNAAGGVFIGIGVVVLIISILWMVLGITLGRPSNVSRWIIIVLVILAIIGDLGSLAGGRNTARGSIGVIVYLAVQALVLYALLIDPNTRRAFAGRR